MKTIKVCLNYCIFLTFQNKKFKLKTYSYGFTHISLTVKDVRSLYRQLKRNKILFNARPSLSKDKKVIMTYCKTPEGAFLELVEEENEI